MSGGLALRRLRRWSFVVTLPAIAVLVAFVGAGAGIVAALVEAAVVLALVLAGARAGGARGEALLDLVMHPSIRRLMRTELALLWTLVEVSTRRLRRRPRGSAFTYHRGSPELGFAIALVPAAAAEVTVIELLLPASWFWPKLAVVVLSVYGVLAMLALAIGMRAYPHRLDGETLVLRLGQLYRARVPLESIVLATVEPETLDTRTRALVRDGTALLLVGGRVDVRLRLAQPVTLERPLGDPVRVTELALRVDEPKTFVERLSTARGGTQQTTAMEPEAWQPART